jgi:hypothetical protein
MKEYVKIVQIKKLKMKLTFSHFFTNVRYISNLKLVFKNKYVVSFPSFNDSLVSFQSDKYFWLRHFLSIKPNLLLLQQSFLYWRMPFYVARIFILHTVHLGTHQLINYWKFLTFKTTVCGIIKVNLVLYYKCKWFYLKYIGKYLGEEILLTRECISLWFSEF